MLSNYSSRKDFELDINQSQSSCLEPRSCSNSEFGDQIIKPYVYDNISPTIVPAYNS